MTALATPPAATPEPALPEVAVPRRLARVSANLMPDEVLVARRLGKLKRRLVVALLAIVALVAGAYVWSWHQTSSAEDGLASAQNATTTLQQSEQSYAPLVSAQASAAQIQSSLSSAMTGDLRWDTLLGHIHSAAPGGVATSGITATVTDTANAASGAVAPSAADVLNNTGLASVGTIAITGTAKDKTAVAAFVDALSRVTGLAGLYPSTVAGQPGAYAFTINGQLTSAALGGRFSAPAGSTATAAGTVTLGGK